MVGPEHSEECVRRTESPLAEAAAEFFPKAMVWAPSCPRGFLVIQRCSVVFSEAILQQRPLATFCFVKL